MKDIALPVLPELRIPPKPTTMDAYMAMVLMAWQSFPDKERVRRERMHPLNGPRFSLRD